MTLLEELKQRELFFDQTDKNLEDFLENSHAVFYLGADPTGDSLHVGHLVTYLVAKRLQSHGHDPILLIGGATGQIGDPKQQGERKMLTTEITNANAKKLEAQVKNIFGFKNIVNNYDWISKIGVIEFLRDYGKYFNVNYMINKDTVKSRLDSGISYTEFSYQILQSLDFLHLHRQMGCNLQIGGQDQWGNLTAGIELIRKKEPESKVYGMTIPLILKTDGTKFGKSEGGKSVWLDKDKTSPYEFYQFWVNTPDSEAIKRLKQFTFLSLDEIKEIEDEWSKAPHLRLAQKTLAYELTSFVHGKESADDAVKISVALFSGKISDLSASQIEMGFADLPSEVGVDGESLVETLIRAKLASSKRESREFIKNNAVAINGVKNATIETIIRKEDSIEERYTLLKRGKKKYCLLKF